jgi:hypothetical protein
MRNAIGAILPDRLLDLVAEVLRSVENFEPYAPHPLEDRRKKNPCVLTKKGVGVSR